MAIPTEYEIRNPDGSLNYKASLLYWINSVPSEIQRVYSDVDSFVEYWSSLTAGQKTAIKAMLVNVLDTERTKLENIVSEINGL